MLTFNFLFGISLGTVILQHSDNLSKTLQHDTITAAEGQQLAKQECKSICKEYKFKSFYDHVLLHQRNLILMHQLFLAKDVLLSGSRLD